VTKEIISNNQKQEFKKCLELLMERKIDKTVERIARIQEIKNPGSYKRTFLKVKAFYCGLPKAKQFKHARIIFGPFERWEK
jgi:hypothetical protein